MAHKQRDRRLRIKRRVRKRISGTPDRPRLSVFRSNREIYAQLIDDTTGVTLTAASSREKTFDAKGTKVARAAVVGETLGRRAKDAEIQAVVFDRNGCLYHGRVKALAEGARKGGLKL
ncbi:MAG: 50S ribosomal protein L18 [Flavobacteriales bacterium]